MVRWTALMIAATLGAPTGDVRRAAQLEAWGDLAEARAEVEAALARDAKDPGASFVAACLDVEEGKLDAARARAASSGAASSVTSRSTSDNGPTRYEAVMPSFSPAPIPWKRLARPCR